MVFKENMCSSSHFINTKKFIGAFVVVGLGTLASLWTNCIFIVCLQRDLYRTTRESSLNSYNLIFQTIQYEYVGICLLATVTLIWGLTNLRWKYLLLWACLKCCENIAIFFGTAVIFTNTDFYGLIPLGITAISINVYALLCVYKAYKRMLVPLPPKNLKNNDCEPLVGNTNEEENVKIKIEEIKPLSTETSIDNIPSDKKITE